MGRKRRRRKDETPGHGKLLDAWDAPDDAGEPIGCLATTFTFSPVLFEEECLGRFVRLESSAQDDGPLYLIEREEKLAQLRCAAALVDRNHCKGPRSLRWDLLPVRPARGILHAKISVLHWSRLVRMIVASANLTEDGYRRNREVFGVLDFAPGREAPVDCLYEVIAFLREIVAQVDPGGATVAPASERCRQFLDELEGEAKKLAKVVAQPKRGHVPVRAIVTGPGKPSAIRVLDEHWPERSPPGKAWVVSPFFDRLGSDNRPAREIWELLRQRGEAAVGYFLTVEEVPGKDDVVLVHAPESIAQATPPNRLSVSTDIYRLSDEPTRPLHAKGVWLDGDRWARYMIGSSNFTSAGLGLDRRPNYEANLFYCVDRQRDREGYKALDSSFPEGEWIDRDKIELRWQPREDDAEDADDESALPLPEPFGPAVYGTGPQRQPHVTLSLTGQPPHGWRLLLEDEDEDEVVYDQTRWEQSGTPQLIQLPWKRDLPPCGFAVRWEGSNGAAWWPVNAEDASSLPPPQELRDIPLEVLLNILTSARPLHHAMRDWIRRKRRGHGGQQEQIVVDPHRRVDTSAFLLQRTRRVSWALHALRGRLARPAATREGLCWRLYGPIGVEKLAEALRKEARSDGERAFLLTELALELGRVQPEEAKGCLAARQVKAEIQKVIRGLRKHVDEAVTSDVANLGEYVRAAFGKAKA